MKVTRIDTRYISGAKNDDILTMLKLKKILVITKIEINPILYVINIFFDFSNLCCLWILEFINLCFIEINIKIRMIVKK